MKAEGNGKSKDNIEIPGLPNWGGEWAITETRNTGEEQDCGCQEETVSGIDMLKLRLCGI